MPSIIAQPVLHANLAALGDLNDDLARALRAAEPSGEVTFHQTDQGVPGARLGGRALCSGHRPLEEADRLIDRVDLLENAVFVVLGFGLGYHVQRLAERLDGAGLIVIYEPDVALLRAVFERIDHASWMREAPVVWITDAQDRAALATKLHGAEAILGQGTVFVPHPPSRARLGDSTRRFSALLSDHITTAKTTLLTTLMRAVDTVRNLLLNLDHYAAGAGVADLAGVAAGRPAVVVSAGPSLHRNLHELARPGVRERVVIIAVQTTLKPLLARGITPHFVTALDYHEISRRFYEGLTAEDVRGVTLVADPKANPVILDLFPGPVRCCGVPFLDQLLGELKRPMGDLPAGATVAHLALFLARHLGCNPIALIGQDLAFTDGLYYAPHSPIHEVWAPELNDFNTIEMMEWQRIVRHRQHLHKTEDVRGRAVYTDAQMLTYLHQFERVFAAYEQDGIEVIDATEGGIAKQHTTALPLAEILDRVARAPLPAWPEASRTLDPERLAATRARIASVRRDIGALGAIAGKTRDLTRRMLQDQADQATMARHFRKLESYRRAVEERFEAFELLTNLNQLGTFKRLRTDRQLRLQSALGPMEKQRAQLERDLENVTWIFDAAAEMTRQLADAERLLAGQAVAPPSDPPPVAVEAGAAASRVAALVPLDPERCGLGLERSLAEPWAGRPVLQRTLERLGRSRELDSIILIAPEGMDLDPLVDPSSIDRPLIIERCDGSPFGREQEAIAAARWWADTCWRGGIAGMSVYDEVLCPQVMHRAMERQGLDAAVLAGPDWPLVTVTGEGGCDALVRRHRAHPDRLPLVFTQAPPGLGGCLVRASLMEELARRNRLATIGGLLVYQPHAPQHDPIARDANVPIPHTVRRSLIRATFDTPENRALLRDAVETMTRQGDPTPEELVAAIEAASAARPPDLPRHVVLELTCAGPDRGRLRAHRTGAGERPPMTEATARRLLESLGQRPGALVTFAGAGDPLCHERFDRFVHLAREHGVRGVHVRTTLLAGAAAVDRLLACAPDVVSIDLHADRAATYEAMMGADRFKEVLLAIESVLERRRSLTGQAGTSAMAMPWIVPRLMRCPETIADVESFFDRWQQMLGTALLEGPPEDAARSRDDGDGDGDGRSAALTPAVTPRRVRQRAARRCMTVLSDGSVPGVGSPAADAPLEVLWQRHLAQQVERRSDEREAPPLSCALARV